MRPMQNCGGVEPYVPSNEHARLVTIIDVHPGMLPCPVTYTDPALPSRTRVRALAPVPRRTRQGSSCRWQPALPRTASVRILLRKLAVEACSRTNYVNGPSKAAGCGGCVCAWRRSGHTCHALIARIVQGFPKGFADLRLRDASRLAREVYAHIADVSASACVALSRSDEHTRTSACAAAANTTSDAEARAARRVRRPSGCSAREREHGHLLAGDHWRRAAEATAASRRRRDRACGWHGRLRPKN